MIYIKIKFNFFFFNVGARKIKILHVIYIYYSCIFLLDSASLGLKIIFFFKNIYLSENVPVSGNCALYSLLKANIFPFDSFYNLKLRPK